MASFAVPVLATVLLGAAAPPVLAQQLPPPNGRYEGRIALGDGPVMLVTLSLGTRYDGRPGSDLRFGEPWACALELEAPIAMTGITHYNFTGAGPGRCVTLTPGGYMRVKPAAEPGAYGIELLKGSNPTVLYSITLRRPASAAGSETKPN